MELYDETLWLMATLWFDPYHPASGPLPPHLLDDADRVGARPTPYLLQIECPSAGTRWNQTERIIKHLTFKSGARV
jgi:hypothetical protein